MQTYQFLLAEIFKIIEEKVFANSQLPFILGIEDHCSKKVRNNIAALAQSHFGPRLCFMSDMSRSSFTDLPTLRQLLGKVIMYGRVALKMSKRREFDFEQSTAKSNAAEEEGLASKNNNIACYKKQNQQLHVIRVKNFGIHSEYSQQIDNNSSSLQQKRTFNLLEYCNSSLDLFQEKLNLSPLQQLFGLFLLPMEVANDIRDKLIIYEIQEFHRHPQQHELICPKETSMYLRKWKLMAAKCRLNLDIGQGLMEHIQMIMMDPHIKDLNHMYHYGIFNGLCGVASPYLPRAPIKRHKSSGKRLSLSGISVGEIAPRFLKVKLISGRQLHHNSNTSLFVQVILKEPSGIQNYISDVVEGNPFSPIFMKDMVFELGSWFSYSALIFIVYDGSFDRLLMWNSFAVKNVRQGYRNIQLMSNSNYKSQLFVKINMF